MVLLVTGRHYLTRDQVPTVSHISSSHGGILGSYPVFDKNYVTALRKNRPPRFF